MVAPVRHDFDTAPTESRENCARARTPGDALEAQARLIRDRALEILERSGIERIAVPPRLVGLGAAACASAPQFAAGLTQPVPIVEVTLETSQLEALIRRAMTQTAPRGRTLAVALSDMLEELGSGEVRKMLRVLRKAMIRGDALLLGAIDWDSTIAMCAAAGFRNQERWIDDATGAALVLFSAD